MQTEKRPGAKRRGARPCFNNAKHARNTHESTRRPLKNNQHLQAISYHWSELQELKKLSGGGTDGRPHKFVWRALATLESSRARSFARSHARTQRNRNRNRNRFPGSGAGLTSLSLPPTSDSFCSDFMRNIPVL